MNNAIQIGDDKPTSVRLKGIKSKLRSWAKEEDRPLAYIVQNILEEAVVKKFEPSKKIKTRYI